MYMIVLIVDPEIHFWHHVHVIDPAAISFQIIVNTAIMTMINNLQLNVALIN